MAPVLSGIPVSVRWSDDGRAIRMLDQTLLPGEERYLRLENGRRGRGGHLDPSGSGSSGYRDRGCDGVGDGHPAPLRGRG